MSSDRYDRIVENLQVEREDLNRLMMTELAYTQRANQLRGARSHLDQVIGLLRGLSDD